MTSQAPGFVCSESDESAAAEDQGARQIRTRGGRAAGAVETRDEGRVVECRVSGVGGRGEEQ